MKQKNTKLTKEELLNKRLLVVENAKEKLHNKKQFLVENAKTQIKKIENEVQSVGNNAETIENNLLESQKKVYDNNISFSQELTRKTVHFISLTIPIGYIFLTKEVVLLILVPMMFLFVSADIASKRIKFLRSLYLKHFGKMLRKHEIQSKRILLNGASWVIISAVLTIFFFPKLIAIVALSVLIISDVFAALVGRKYGKTRFLGLKKKSWEGTIAFFISALVVVTTYGFLFCMPIPFFIAGIIAAATSAFAEAISKEVLKTDDNLAIPISFGIIMWTGDAASVLFFHTDFTFPVNNIINFVI